MRNDALLLTARFGVRQAGGALAHVARPAAFYLMRCSRTLGRYAAHQRVDSEAGDDYANGV